MRESACLLDFVLSFLFWVQYPSYIFGTYLWGLTMFHENGPEELVLVTYKLCQSEEVFRLI